MEYQLIIAGDYQQFLNYLKKHKIPRPNAVYISDVQSIYGRTQKELENIIWTGTYWQRKDIDLIQNLLRARNIQQEDRTGG